MYLWLDSIYYMVREDKYNIMMLFTHALTGWKRNKIWIKSNLQYKDDKENVISKTMEDKKLKFKVRIFVLLFI